MRRAALKVANRDRTLAAAGQASGDVKLAPVGLSNGAGQNNCYLNSILQCLWACFAFRKLVLGWAAAVYEANCVLHALRSLFDEYYALAVKLADDDLLCAEIDPVGLRIALAEWSRGHFEMGEMNEAEEVLRACVAEAGEPALHDFDAIFAMFMRELVSCGTCRTSASGARLVTTLHEDMELVNCIDASVMRQLLEDGGKKRFGSLLRLCGKELEQQRYSDCGRLQEACRAITNKPAVFTVGLGWTSDSETGDSIVAALQGIKKVLHLEDVNADAQGSSPVGIYRLRAAVAYYGKHYTALVYKPKVGWVSVDDTLVCEVGEDGYWYEVMRKCKKGRLQLTTLFYIRDA